MMRTIKVTKEFKAVPMGRSDGAAFRDMFLSDVYQNKSPVVIDLNQNKFGYGSSFLEEAFGGLVRKTGINFEEFKQLYTIEHKHSFYIGVIENYVQTACDEYNKLQIA